MSGTFDTSVRSYRMYVRDTTGPALTLDFADAKLEFIDQGDGRTNFVCNGLILSNDAATEVEFSFDGISIEGQLLAGESMNFFQIRRKVVWLRGTAGGEAYRVWAW